MSEIRVAAAQAVSRRGEIEKNVLAHVRMATRAADEGVNVMVFPELSLTGYELDLAEELAFSEDDARVAPLAAVAEERKLMIVAGAPIRLSSGLHIGALVLEPLRPARRRQIYTKRHLHASESQVFVPGTRDPLLEVGEDRAALAICADTSHPEHAAVAAKRGASLYLAGVFTEPDHYTTTAERLAGYARQYGMAVVLANSGAPCSHYDTPGGSAVWSQTGRLVASLEGPGEGLVIARQTGSDWSGKALRL